jgi:phosphatidylglycerophosphatase A
LVPDEVAGFLTTVLLWRTDDLLLTIVWAFGLTRVLDILKPPPCRRLERLPGGWGVLADDLCASLYAAAILHVAAWQWPSVFGKVFWAA